MMTSFSLQLICVALSIATSEAYHNPIRYPGPDPSMVYADGSYYMTHTSDTYIEMSKAETLDALVFGETKTIWEDTNATRSAHMWAPEIHQIDDIWYMLYSSCHANVTCCETCMTRILRGCDGSNPYDCDYEFLADLVPPPGRRGGPEKNLTYSIDGT